MLVLTAASVFRQRPSWDQEGAFALLAAAELGCRRASRGGSSVYPSFTSMAWLLFSVCRQCSDRACRDGFSVARSLERHLDPKWPFHLVLTEQPVPALFFYYSRRLESATRSLKISAPQRVVIESWANEISASCLTDLKLQSVHGAIRLDAKSVYVKGLKTAIPVQGHSSREQQQQQQQQQHSGRSSSAHQSQRDTSIYQLCACASGKLFLARPDGNCQADKSIC